MELFTLILYGAINIAMVLWYLLNRGRFYQFPFWAGVIALGWFYPQAIGGYLNVWLYPENAYTSGMLFASLCTVALWIGFERTIHKPVKQNRLFAIQYNSKKLYQVGVFLILIGFFFQWKLYSLPEEMLAQTQWSGATVKYLFLASIFKIGFLILFVQYLRLGRWRNPKFLFFLIPCLLLMLSTAILHGRRAEMMNLFAYIVVSLWIIRKIAIPKGLVIVLVTIGILLINGIGQYRYIMSDKYISFSQRITKVLNTDFLSLSNDIIENSGSDFNNYIIYRYFSEKFNEYDFGMTHWNGFIFNFIPAQIVGKQLKNSLMRPLPNITKIAADKYGYIFGTGGVTTGYFDAFTSFWWFGFIKFFLIGWLMSVLYCHAMHESFLSQILYVYVLSSALEAISHGTHQILVSVWVYFILFGFPFLYWARSRKHKSIKVVRRNPNPIRQE